MKLNRIFTLTVLAIALMIPASQTLAAAFGVSPPWIINQTLKPGTNFSYTIDLSTNDLSKAKKVTTNLVGDDEVLKWVTVRAGSELEMPAGQAHYPMMVDLKVPADAKLGEYSGFINLKVVPEDQKNKVSIALGGHIKIDLKVINRNVTDYSVNYAEIKSLVEGQPMDLSMKVKNLGNTDLTTIKTELEVLEKDTNQSVAKFSLSELSRSIEPNTTGLAHFLVPTQNLPAGKYWAKVKVSNGSKEIYANRLHLLVDPLDINQAVKTSVAVGDAKTLKGSAPDRKAEMISGSKSVVQTSVMVGSESARAHRRNVGKGVLALIVLTLIASAGYNSTRKS